MRKKDLHTRVNTETDTWISDLASKNDRSKSYMLNFIIQTYFSEDIEKIIERDKKYRTQILYELRRYGNNLNQIAFKLNVALKTDQIDEVDKLSILEAIQQLDYVYGQIDNILVLLTKRL